MIRADDILLTAEELRVRGRKRRNLLAIVVGLVLAVVATFFGARPAAHSIKAWQARRHAHRAFTYIQNEQWNDAQREASAAYQLVPTEPQALRAVARFLSRIHQSEALDFWKQLEERQSLTREDRRDEIAVALSADDLSVAQSALEELLARKESPPSAIDWLLAAQVAQQNSETAEARKFTKKVLDDLHADEREQFQAALLMLALSSTEKAKAESVEAGWARLKKLAEGKTKTALAALVILAQRALSDTPSTINHQPPVAPQFGEGGSTIADLIRALETHPLAKTPHKLLALDLQIHADPTQRDVLISRAIANWKNADTASLVALATWLDGKTEYQRQLDTIPAEKALQSRDLFLLRLDALGALDRWSEIKQLLESEHFPLDQVAERMYVARCNAQLGEKTASENNWKRALEAAGDDSGKLMTLAEYAERNGAKEIAEVAYASAANASPKLRAAWQGRLRIAQASGDTRKMHDVLTDMVAIWPNDSSIQNDEAYIRLLLLFSNSRNDQARTSNDERMKGIERLAEKLVERNPHSLPHRSLLALTRLLRGRVAEALDVYANIQVAPGAHTSSALAVHAAVLAANGNANDAKIEAAQITMDSLLPQEKELIQNLL
jgi:hypothetical protein